MQRIPFYSGNECKENTFSLSSTTITLNVYSIEANLTQPLDGKVRLNKG